MAGIYTVPVEQQWVSRIHIAAEALKAAGTVDYTYTENVANTDYPRVMREYCEAGVKLIVGEIFGAEAEALHQARVHRDLAPGHAPGVELLGCQDDHFPVPLGGVRTEVAGLGNQPVGDGPHPLHLAGVAVEEVLAGGRLHHLLKLLARGLFDRGLGDHHALLAVHAHCSTLGGAHRLARRAQAGQQRQDDQAHAPSAKRVPRHITHPPRSAAADARVKVQAGPADCQIRPAPRPPAMPPAPKDTLP